MTPSPEPQWLNWCRQLQAIAQNGLTFATDAYDIERYTALRQIASEMLSKGSGLDVSLIRGLLNKEVNYATPKVDVRGVVFDGDKLLMVREKSDGKWTLPGGWADIGASPAENVVREIHEEAGLLTRPSKLLAVYDRSLHPHEPPFAFHIYKLFFLCSMLSGAPTAGSETDAAGFFAEKDIPELSVSRVTAGQIRRMFEHHRNPGLPADFDPAD